MASVAQKLARRAGDYIRMTAALPIAVTATANTDLTLTLPAGVRNVAFRTITTTAFGAATDATIAIGNAAAGAQYVAAVSIKAAGVVSHSYATGATAELDTVPGVVGTLTTIYVRIAQSGTASATGAATLFADYSMPVS